MRAESARAPRGGTDARPARTVRLSRNGTARRGPRPRRGAPPRRRPAVRLPPAAPFRRAVDTDGHPHTHLAFFAFCLVFLVTAFSQISA
ncbi:hypothetical protein D5R55_16420 [Burkholderia cenocepacia]|uniref:Uncharacterized protein n=1 Tax=Burkholderia cenocepacia TaxID=95486 RepID=A0A3S9NA05_9BURK|nr:hypothetical protein D5R55_16420 [Burkholderia cenocepacia]